MCSGTNSIAMVEISLILFLRSFLNTSSGESPDAKTAPLSNATYLLAYFNRSVFMLLIAQSLFLAERSIFCRISGVNSDENALAH